MFTTRLQEIPSESICFQRIRWSPSDDFPTLLQLVNGLNPGVSRRTVVGDTDQLFDNMSGRHHQSHVNCVSSVYGIYVSGQLSRDVIGCFKSNRWLSRDVIGCWFIKSCCYLL